MTEPETIYQQRILDHYKNPSHYGTLDNAPSETGINPLCGDEITFYIIVSNKKIESIAFTSKGCAISTAAASLLTEKLSKASITVLESFRQSHFLEYLGVTLSPALIKCALLPYITAQQLLSR